MQQLLLGTQATGEAFVVPSEAATQKFAFLARSGAGKTYAASKLAEEMHAAHIQIVILDPVGIWYGLRLAADGEHAGLPIPVFGGEHGDISLTPHSGRLVADIIVDRQLSIVLDVSSFRKHERQTFVTDLAEQLFHRKKTARSPLHLFLEEAQTFIPQKSFRGEERMLGAFEDIGKIGRNYGIGFSLISQRPQSVNKDVLNMAEVLIVLQMNAAQERKAIREWVDAQGIAAAAAISDLPHLAIGDAYVWSPQWLRFFGKIHIGQKWTYDASATPTFAATLASPRPLDNGELTELTLVMRAALQEADQDNPRLLREQISTLQRQLNMRDKLLAVERVIEQVAVPVITDEQMQLLTYHIAAAEQAAHVADQAARTAEQTAHELHTIVTELRQAFARVSTIVVSPPQLTASQHTAPTPEYRSTAHLQEAHVETNEVPPNHTNTAVDIILEPKQQAMLDALRAFEMIGVPIVEVANIAIWSDQSPTSSAVGRHLRVLRESGLLHSPQTNHVALTDAGRAHTLSTAPLASLNAFHQAWYNKLEQRAKPMAAMVRVLVDAYPEAVQYDTLALQTNQSPTSSAVERHIRNLRSLGVIQTLPGRTARAAELLFPALANP